MKRFILLCLLGVGGILQVAVAQNKSSLRPRWMGNVPKGNHTFYFVEVHTDMASTLSGARSVVLKELSACVEREDKVLVNEIYEDQSKQQYSSPNKVSFTSEDQYHLKLQVDGFSSPIHSRRIDEYWKGNNYYALYAVERKGFSADFSGIDVTSRYGVRGLWRSMIVPGWGQFHKGANLKGGLILGGCAALAVGIIFTESQRSDYMDKIGRTHDADFIRDYLHKADNFETVRNICIGTAAALYLYNLIDAIAAPGARRVIVKNRNTRNYAYSIAPGIMRGGTVGVVAAVTFK